MIMAVERDGPDELMPRGRGLRIFGIRPIPPDHPGRTDGPRPAGPPGTDGRTRKALKDLISPYFFLFFIVFP